MRCTRRAGRLLTSTPHERNCNGRHHALHRAIDRRGHPALHRSGDGAGCRLHSEARGRHDPLPCPRYFTDYTTPQLTRVTQFEDTDATERAEAHRPRGSGTISSLLVLLSTAWIMRADLVCKTEIFAFILFSLFPYLLSLSQAHSHLTLAFLRQLRTRDRALIECRHTTRGGWGTRHDIYPGDLLRQVWVIVVRRTREGA